MEHSIVILSDEIIWTWILHLFPFRSNAHAPHLLLSVIYMTGTPRAPT